MRYLGKWRAIVTDNKDPKKQGRVKARVADILDPGSGKPLETDWAYPAYSCHCKHIPAVGSTVWIEFEAPAEQPYNPIWSGMFMSIPDGISEIPTVAQQTLVNPLPFGRGLAEIETTDLSSVGGKSSVTYTEPASMQSTEYPNNQVCETPSKILIEQDDTPNNRRIHLHVGDYDMEAREDGVLVEHSTTKHEYVLEGSIRGVLGDDVESIEGDKTLNISGNLDLAIDGDIHAITGSVNAKLGTFSIKINTSDIAGTKMVATGKLILNSTSELFLGGLNSTLFGLSSSRIIGGKQVTVETLSRNPADPIDANSGKISIIARGAPIIDGSPSITLDSQSKTITAKNDGSEYAVVVYNDKLQEALQKLMTHTHPADGMPSLDLVGLDFPKTNVFKAE
jgi:hypothetical protein